jgi:hypothetical protein
MGFADNVSFAHFAASRGVLPGFHPRHGAEAVELLNLIETVEEVGDKLLRAVGDEQIDYDIGMNLLERLLKCYSNPLSNSRMLMQIRIETGKLTG